MMRFDEEHASGPIIGICHRIC